MEIKTKFNLGDKVWFMRDNEVHTAKVIEITVNKAICFTSLRGYSEIITYKVLSFFCGTIQFPEKSIFPTKDDLLKSL